MASVFFAGCFGEEVSAASTHDGPTHMPQALTQKNTLIQIKKMCGWGWQNESDARTHSYKGERRLRFRSYTYVSFHYHTIIFCSRHKLPFSMAFRALCVPLLPLMSGLPSYLPPTPSSTHLFRIRDFSCQKHISRRAVLLMNSATYFSVSGLDIERLGEWNQRAVTTRWLWDMTFLAHDSRQFWNIIFLISSFLFHWENCLLGAIKRFVASQSTQIFCCPYQILVRITKVLLSQSN